MQPNQPDQGQQNPFLALLAQKQGGQPSMGSGMGMAGAMMQQGQPQGPQGQPDPNAAPPSDQIGQTGDNTKPLTEALRAMHNYLAQETDRGDISMARSVIALLSQIILHDQQQAQQKDQQSQQGAPVNATMLPEQSQSTPPTPGQ